MQADGIFVLADLNQKYHQKGNYGGACINDQLPCVGIMEEGTGNDPN